MVELLALLARLPLTSTQCGAMAGCANATRCCMSNGSIDRTLSGVACSRRSEKALHKGNESASPSAPAERGREHHIICIL
jgi:hypothetical protein